MAAWFMWVPSKAGLVPALTYVLSDGNLQTALQIHRIPQEMYAQVKAHSQGDTLRAIEYLAGRFPYNGGYNEAVPKTAR